MREFETTKDWVTKAGLRAAIVMNDLGFHCGYVGVPPGHPLHGVDYMQTTPALDDAPECIFDAHGGLTYAGDGKGEYPVKSDLWWFGYDCGHVWDAPSPAHVEKMKRRYPDTPFMWGSSGGVFRGLDYCINECERLAEQIVEKVKTRTPNKNAPSSRRSLGAGKHTPSATIRCTCWAGEPPCSRSLYRRRSVETYLAASWIRCLAGLSRTRQSLRTFTE